MSLTQFMEALTEVPGLNEKAKGPIEGVMSPAEIKLDKEEFLARYMVT